MENKDSNSGNGKQVMMISQQSNLSHELIFEEILTRLPVKSILRFKSVSKQWYSTLSSSHFAKAHLKKSPFSHPCAYLIITVATFSTDYFLSYLEVDEISQNFQDYLVKPTYLPWLEEGNFLLELLVSCNGLVCITSTDGEYFILWNPATRKLNKYAPPTLDVFFNRFDKILLTYFETCGFGHVSSADDYKFVGILKVIHENYSESLFALIFSLRENRWTTIDLDDYIPHFYTSPGLLVSEKIYWGPCAGQVNKVVSFDLAVERFDVVEFDLVEFDETLGMTAMKPIELPLLDDMNILDSQKIGFTKNDKLLFVFDGTMLTIPETSTTPLNYAQFLKFDGQQCFKITRFIPSFVSPFPPSQEDSEIRDVTF